MTWYPCRITGSRGKSDLIVPDFAPLLMNLYSVSSFPTHQREHTFPDRFCPERREWEPVWLDRSPATSVAVCNRCGLSRLLARGHNWAFLIYLTRFGLCDSFLDPAGITSAGTEGCQPPTRVRSRQLASSSPVRRIERIFRAAARPAKYPSSPSPVGMALFARAYARAATPLREFR